MTVFDQAIWWHVYPLGATGAPIRPESAPTEPAHRLRQLEAWLDYAVELGCSGIFLGPIFASSTHGYDTTDYYSLDPRLGDDDDWSSFVAAAHSRGLLIMLDGVFNHVGAHHPLVSEALAGNGMVRISGDSHQGWEGHGDLAELDHSDPRVADLVTDVMTHWLERGADAWRLDVAYAVPSEFWATVTDRVRQTHPNVGFLGEVIHGDYAEIAASGHLDSITAYELWKATWSSITDRNFWELASALERHNGFSQRVLMNTFIGNHDVNRIASQVGDDGAVLAAVVLLTVPGMPSIYYGDEQAFRGEKGEGYDADDAVRPALPQTPAELSPAGCWLYRIYQELVALRRRHPWLTTGELEVVDKTNETIHYRVAGQNHVAGAADGGEHTADVHLDLTDAFSVSVEVDGSTEFQWPR